MKAARNRTAGPLFIAGVLAAGLAVYYARFYPAPDALAPRDAEQQRQLAASSGATAEAVSLLEARLTAARARLSSAAAFDARMRSWRGNWIVATRSVEPSAGLEVRHYGLAYDHPEMTSWPDILETIKIICAEPGLSIDRVALAAAPDSSEAFRQVEINLTVRLRP